MSVTIVPSFTDDVTSLAQAAPGWRQAVAAAPPGRN